MSLQSSQLPDWLPTRLSLIARLFHLFVRQDEHNRQQYPGLLFAFELQYQVNESFPPRVGKVPVDKGDSMPDRISTADKKALAAALGHQAQQVDLPDLKSTTTLP